MLRFVILGLVSVRVLPRLMSLKRWLSYKEPFNNKFAFGGVFLSVFRGNSSCGKGQTADAAPKSEVGRKSVF